MQSELAAKIFGDKEDPRRRLESLFGGTSAAVGPPLAAREWARTVLREAGVNPTVSPVEAIACFRRA